MSGEEVVQILNEEIEELIVGLADGLQDSYDELKRIYEDMDEDRDEFMDMMRELVGLMKDAGRISAEQADEIMKRMVEE